jgi:phosphoribosylanthranilate isomerase
VPLILAGGLTPDNVAAAAAAAQPFAVDTARGTEAEPGIKDPERMRAFFAALTTPAPTV